MPSCVHLDLPYRRTAHTRITVCDNTGIPFIWDESLDGKQSDFEKVKFMIHASNHFHALVDALERINVLANEQKDAGDMLNTVQRIAQKTLKETEGS